MTEYVNKFRPHFYNSGRRGLYVGGRKADETIHDENTCFIHPDNMAELIVEITKAIKHNKNYKEIEKKRKIKEAQELLRSEGLL